MKRNLIFTSPTLTQFNSEAIRRLLSAGLAFCCLLLAACSDDGQKESPTPGPEPDEPAIVIPDTEDTAPVIAQEGGTATVSFTASADWTAEATAVTRALDWVSVQPASGPAGDVTLTITTQPNDTYDERNAAIVLACAGERTTFTVSQKQKDALLLTSDKVELDATGGGFTLALQANVPVTYEIEPGADWLKSADTSTKALEDLSFAFHAEENTDTEARQATITLSGNGLTETVTVFQAGTAPVLVLGQQEYIVGSAGETLTVELQSNTDYRVQLPAVDWLTEVDTRSLSAYTHYFAVAPNDTYDARTAEIIFTTADGTLADTVFVTQVQQDAILLAQREYAFPAEGGTLSFSVQANVQPEVLCEAGWLHPVETRGLTEHAFAYTVDENTGYDARQADLIVRDVNNPLLADTLTVRQAYRDAIIVAQREYDIPAEGGTLDFTVQTNVDVTATADVDWITQAPGTRGLVEKNLCFDIAPNEGTEARQGTITLSGGGVTQTVTVRQEAYEEPELVRVEYRTGYEWHEPEYNLPLRYNAIVYRDRYYDNGEVITDTFVDAAHMASFMVTRTPEFGGYWTDRGIPIEWGEQTFETFKMNGVEGEIGTAASKVPDPSLLVPGTVSEKHDTNPGDWDAYVVSKLYDTSEFISAAEVPSNGGWPSDDRASGWYFGWYFNNCGFHRNIEINYQAETLIEYVSRYAFVIDVYDQFLVIDGRRIDFLKYRPEYHYNLSIENGVVTCDLRFTFMGRNFYAAFIETFTAF